MRGRIVKGIAGFYYIWADDERLYECKAKGIFRKDGRKPLVGDYVDIAIIDSGEQTGNIEEILPRKNALIRPNVANVDQAFIIFAITQPKPNLNLLDRFLVTMELQNVKTVICFNKLDIAPEEDCRQLREVYEKSGYEVHFVSTLQEEGMDAISRILDHKTTVLAGPSGVGKSSMINRLQSTITMETGAISRKIDRGKHTTRHSELIYVAEDTYIVDTPGFSSLYLTQLQAEELKMCYPEFLQYEEQCRFQGCVHIHEPDCAVKQALENGKISSIRYENYGLLYEELKNKKRY